MKWVFLECGRLPCVRRRFGATLVVTRKGQTAACTGALAYTFSKHGEAWKIDGQAWGRTS